MASSTNVSKRSKIPSTIIELQDVAIFQFASMSGLRLGQKLRGDPVLEGVSAVFAQVIACSKAEVRSQFEENASRLGNWKPGLEPSKELKTLISGRIRQKKDVLFRRNDEPDAPEAVVFHDREFDEDNDRVVIKGIHPRCWRCRDLCRYCKELNGLNILSDGFKPDLTSPLLEVLGGFEDVSQEEEESEEEERDEEESVDEEGAASLYADFKNQHAIEDEDEDNNEMDEDEERSEEEDISE